MRRRGTTILAVCCAALLLTACGGPSGDRPESARGAALPGDFGGTGPGTLVAAESLPNLDPALRDLTSTAARITYLSTSGVNDSHPRVSATVFVPKGQPPPGGWRIVAFGHPATGIAPECAPSASPTLLGSAPTVSALVDAGFMVTMTDYQGLGRGLAQGSGQGHVYHPFLDSTTEGYDLIDSVRAARKLVSGTSNTWVAYGVGQGGQAAWAADELTPDYRGDLQLMGTVAVTPTAALVGLADEAADGSLTTDQQLLLQQFLAALTKEYDDFDVDHYRHGVVRAHWDVLSSCWGRLAEERSQIAAQIGPDDLRPDGDDATQVLRGYLQKTSLPQAPTAAPMVLVPDEPGGLIPPAQTAAAAARACAMGDAVAYRSPPAADEQKAVLGWLADFFDGAPAQNDCPFPATVNPG